jgi:hypothetical protein
MSDGLKTTADASGGYLSPFRITHYPLPITRLPVTGAAQ